MIMMLMIMIMMQMVTTIIGNNVHDNEGVHDEDDVDRDEDYKGDGSNVDDDDGYEEDDEADDNEDDNDDDEDDDDHVDNDDHDAQMVDDDGNDGGDDAIAGQHHFPQDVGEGKVRNPTRRKLLPVARSPAGWPSNNLSHDATGLPPTPSFGKTCDPSVMGISQV